MNYQKPTLGLVQTDAHNASCCTPLISINLGRVVVTGGCQLGGGQG